jgi:hypothetical protein
MVILLRKAQLVAAVETTEGVPEIAQLTAANAILVITPSFSATQEQHERENISATMSPLKTISGKRSAEISFSVELKGSGTPGEPPKWRHLLRACGFAELPSATDVLYRPTSEAIPSLTIALFEDGLRKTIWGARGTVDFAFTNGTFARMNFTFTGADFEVVDAPLLEGVAYMGTIPPIFMNSTFTVHGFNAVIQQVTFDMANTVALRESVAAAGGHVSAFITSRRPVGTINPEMVSVATHPFYDEWRDGVEGTLTFSMGGEVGNRIEVTAPLVRYSGISEEDRDGVRTLSLDFELNTSPGDGDDELAIRIY